MVYPRLVDVTAFRQQFEVIAQAAIDKAADITELAYGQSLFVQDVEDKDLPGVEVAGYGLAKLCPQCLLGAPLELTEAAYEIEIRHDVPPNLYEIVAR